MKAALSLAQVLLQTYFITVLFKHLLNLNGFSDCAQHSVTLFLHRQLDILTQHNK
jgi:hypothetical protein